MWYRIMAFPRTVSQVVLENIYALKKDERGLSGVVVAILLILVAVLAIIMIWIFLGDWLAELWEQITGRAGDIS